MRVCGSVLAGLLLILSGSASAQTATYKIAWDHTEAPAASNLFQFTLKVDAATPTAIAAACVQKATGSTCSAPLPALSSGTHTLVITAYNGFGSTPSDPVIGGPPSKAVNVSVTVTVTVP